MSDRVQGFTLRGDPNPPSLMKTEQEVLMKQVASLYIGQQEHSSRILAGVRFTQIRVLFTQIWVRFTHAAPTDLMH